MIDADRENMRMTVLAVYPWPDFWSMGARCGAPSFHLSVTSFPKHGHEMHVLLPGAPDAPRHEEYHGVHLHRIRTRLSFMPEVGLGSPIHHLAILLAFVYWFIRAVPAGLRLAARIEPDVVFGMGSLGAIAGRMLARARGIPNVTRLFGTELVHVAGNRLKFLLRYRDIAAYKTAASYVIACDDGSASDEIARRLGVDMSRFRHWLNGVDKARYVSAKGGPEFRAEHGIPEGNRVVLSVSRLHPEKGVDRLIQAAPQVLAERGDVTFLIVGSGEESDRLHALAERLGVRDRLVFTGAIPREELPSFYATSDLFVTLSDRTNVLNPLHEAMISGLPVVALDAGRTCEIIRDGETGVLLDAGELDRLPRIILELLSDEEKRRALGEGARASADRRLPSFEERQAMEVEIVERAVREHRSGRRD